MAKPSQKTRKRKAPGATSSRWQKVPVSLPDDGADEEHNHYDNRDLQRHAEKDLLSNPGEDMGFFLGLEVIDGNDYRVENRNGTRMLVIKGEEEGGGEESSSPSRRRHEQDEPLSKPHQEGEDEHEEERSSRDPPKKKRRKKKKKQVAATSEMEIEDGPSSQRNDAETQPPTANTQKKKKKEKRKSKLERQKKSTNKTVNDQQASVGAIDSVNGSAAASVDPAQVTQMQTAWMSQTGGVTLHNKICEFLVQQDFWTPTPIQAGCLPAAILGRRNIVGSAPTGSGKTLAFVLPIFQSILDAEDRQKNELDLPDKALQALVIAPSRELARQLVAECEKIAERRVAIVVGGLAHVKQQRILSRRPPIVVGTPGRLWEMISSRDYEHLNDLSRIKYLVIDEADRMIQLGNFPQLANILDAVQRANPMLDDDDDGDDNEHNLADESQYDDMDRMLGLPGVPGEARVKMLTPEILKQIEALRGDTVAEPLDDSRDNGSDDEASGSDQTSDDDMDEELVLPSLPPVYRQTFVFSATLTLPSTTRSTKPTKGGRSAISVGGAISEILDKAHAIGKTKVVDLSTNTKGNELIEPEDNKAKAPRGQKKPPGASKFQLPPGLQLQQVSCTQKHKDSYLYAYLMATAEGNSGPCLVFCNSIAAVRRVGKTLETLGLDVRILHAQMQQRARFKVIERIRDSRSRMIVVATDVAARGLDIPSIRSVIHYDVARSVDTFVHRAGRTARGMGDSAKGHSFSLVCPAEDKAHSAILAALSTDFNPVAIDGRLLRKAQERANLAAKVVQVAEVERYTQSNNQWFKQQAREAGLDLDDDLLEDGLGHGKRDRAKLQNALMARERLARLLAEPIQTQRYGKFLSTNSAAPIGMGRARR